MGKWILLLILCFPFIIQGQNLVPNPGFEAAAYLPTQLSSTGLAFERAIKHWSTPNEASTDLISPSFRSKNLTPIPPRSGKNMAGIVINGDYWAEYACVKLRDSLKVGTSYYVEFWMSMPIYYSKRKPIPTTLNNYFGVRFDKYFYQSDKRILNRKPQINATDEILVEPEVWTKVFGTFVADTAANYIYIGQFLPPGKDPVLSEGYFLIDDVYVEAFSSEAVDYVPSRYYKIEEGVASIKMDNIYFETDKYDLLPESFSELDKLVNILKKNPTITIDIQGHTDDEGSEDYNLELSNSRAATVRNYVINQGIDESRLKSQGYGLSKPKADNTTEEGRQENRRVEFVVIGDPVANSRQVLDPEQVYRLSDNIDKKRHTDLSFIGKYRRDWDCPDLASRKIVDEKQQQSFSAFAPRDAKKFLLEKTTSQRAVFFNESHAHPQTRAFITTLLEDLAKQGFSYLGLEALNREDTELNSRAYPVLNSGYYLKDPVYSDLVRKAISMGFEVFAYHPNPTELDKAQKIIKSKGFRGDEQVLKASATGWSQAMNISRILRKDVDAKMVIISSADAAKEKGIAGKKHMAQWFKEISGINPLTVDQSHMVEYCPEKTDPLYKKLQLKTPTVYTRSEKVFVQRDFDPTSDERFLECYDIQIFHPKTVYKNNRPTWLRMDGLRKTYPFNPDKHGMGYPCMVRAYLDGEDPAFAVPVDVIEVVNAATPVALVLPPGDYQLIMRDREKNKKLEITVNE